MRNQQITRRQSSSPMVGHFAQTAFPRGEGLNRADLLGGHVGARACPLAVGYALHRLGHAHRVAVAAVGGVSAIAAAVAARAASGVPLVGCDGAAAMVADANWFGFFDHGNQEASVIFTEASKD